VIEHLSIREELMKILFLLRHRRVLFDDVFDTKWIGWYSTAEKAQAAIDRAVLLEGFRDYPDGFELFEVEVDKVYFEEGF
jgi:hypothetical protein